MSAPIFYLWYLSVPFPLCPHPALPYLSLRMPVSQPFRHAHVFKGSARAPQTIAKPDLPVLQTSVTVSLQFGRSRYA